MTDVLVLQVWSGDRSKDPDLVHGRDERHHGEPPFVRVGRPHKLTSSEVVTIGRAPDSTVVVDDPWVSNTAVVLSPGTSGWSATMHNRHGTQYRTWGQQAQPLRGGTRDSSAGRPCTVALRGDQHAFLFPCGSRYERFACVTLEMRVQSVGEDGDLLTATSGDTTPTPPGLADAKTVLNPQRVARIRQVYWQFLVWPPRLQPRGVRPNSFKVQVGKDHVEMLKLVERYGYPLPVRPTELQDVLPEQLVELGILRFDDHALWRDAHGRILPYLTDTEQYRRAQIQWHGHDTGA